MDKLKLMTIVGTRPEIIKMSAIIKKCDKYFNIFLFIQVRTTTTNSMRFSSRILDYVSPITIWES